MELVKELISQQRAELLKKEDNLLYQALTNLNINPHDPGSIKDATVIIKEGDPYKHYYLNYGKENEIRVLSIEKVPSVSFDEKDGRILFTATQKYY